VKESKYRKGVEEAKEVIIMVVASRAAAAAMERVSNGPSSERKRKGEDTKIECLVHY